MVFLPDLDRKGKKNIWIFIEKRAIFGEKRWNLLKVVDFHEKMVIWYDLDKRDKKKKMIFNWKKGDFGWDLQKNVKFAKISWFRWKKMLFGMIWTKKKLKKDDI